MLITPRKRNLEDASGSSEDSNGSSQNSIGSSQDNNGSSEDADRYIDDVDDKSGYLDDGVRMDLIHNRRGNHAVVYSSESDIETYKRRKVFVERKKHDEDDSFTSDSE